ncbi:ROK family protein [Lactiplantibacillus fabifermentans]|uniref:Transcriptional regulator sugar kinase n=2 Tax=Lactiplantibacillus fabifermentans TaxID=483011 RepID=A0A0R2NQM2_9LACO|nr:ROK family protein [Lactiplantibacillus fabifermentans]ETY72732.1 transcriptional regulator [Lactiplantibacillus fabifermentans T30PCM01]KRO28006.1 transcriptional regulator sugar kinase [Lactiplantibacillus fabifermentans DSM 21115]
MEKYLAIDIGGTDVKYAIIDREGHQWVLNKMRTVTTSLAAFVTQLQRLVDHYQDEISGIAISVPGRVQHPTDRIDFGGSLPFLNGVCLADELTAVVPIVVENDGKAATLAELWHGELKAVNNGLVLVLGTAVGGGLVLNHQLVRGDHDQAGELSFMTSGSQFTPQLMYGSQGSAVAMIETIAETIHLASRDDGPAVFDALTAGNQEALAIFTTFCRRIATLIQNVQTLVDVHTVVIGGGIAAQPLVTQTINTELDQLRLASPLMAATLSRPHVVTSHYQSRANLYGALYQLLLTTNAIKVGQLS